MTPERSLKLAPPRIEFSVPEGGVDQVTPPLQLRDGNCIDALNFEVDINGGYRRIGGLDRWDGYTTVETMIPQTAVVSKVSGFPPEPGAVLLGTSSGARMTYRKSTNPDNRAGLLGDNESTFASIYVSDVIGQFFSGEDATVAHPLTGITAVFKINTPPTPIAGATPVGLAKAYADARNDIRAIMRKPGESTGRPEDYYTIGPVLGTAHFRGVTWVFRESRIDRGTAQWLRPAKEDDQIEGRRDQWVRSAPLTVPTEGCRMRFIEHNFAGGTASRYLYGVTGTSKAFFYDGTDWTEISTGAAPEDDKPSFLAAYANRLALAIGSSVIISTSFDPTLFSGTLGATEWPCGDDITGLLSLKSSDQASALLISTKSKTLVLYGDNAGNFELRTLQEETGAEVSSLQMLSQPIFMNDFGISTLAASDTYGGFKSSSISDAMKRFLDDRRRTVTASMVVRSKNQYRLFFSDGYALYITMDRGKLKGMMPVYLGKRITCAWTSIEDDGEEMMLVGDDEGYIYRIDVGNSIDGEPIYYFLRMAFNHLRSPRVRKRYRHATLEIDSTGYTEFDFGFDIDYGAHIVGVTNDLNVQSPMYGSGGFFDDSTWDQFYYDAAAQVPVVMDCDGTGENISLRLQGRNNYVDPFRLTGVILQYSFRRQSR